MRTLLDNDPAEKEEEKENSYFIVKLKGKLLILN